jgi:hypothetical protein
MRSSAQSIIIFNNGGIIMNAQKFTVVLTALTALVIMTAAQAFAQPERGRAPMTPVERGKYLVTICACNDCHSPKVFTLMGPVPDTTRMLSGRPANSPMPALSDSIIGMTPDKWGAIGTADLTAWRGPWGTSFPTNLTPDTATGLGSWTEEMFMNALRTGKHMGKGRDLLPPMPWMFYGQMTDRDLKAVFAYLRSLPPISNAIPDPIPPPGAAHK